MKKLFSVLLVLFVFGICFANNSYSEMNKIVNDFYNKGHCVIYTAKNGNTVYITKESIATITVWKDGSVILIKLNNAKDAESFGGIKHEIKLDENYNIIITSVK